MTKSRSTLIKNIIQNYCENESQFLNFIVTWGEFGRDVAFGCSCGSGSGSGLCGLSDSGSVLGELSSLCLLSSNNNLRRSSWVHTCIIENNSLKSIHIGNVSLSCCKMSKIHSHMAQHFFRLDFNASNMHYKHPQISLVFSWTIVCELSGCQWSDNHA